jgi:hypothetical protein
MWNLVLGGRFRLIFFVLRFLEYLSQGGDVTPYVWIIAHMN